MATFITEITFYLCVMPEKKGSKIRRETLVEKLVRRSLETVGGSVDSVFGRGKKPDALPATSDLSERLRRMIDHQAQVNKDGRKLAPHLISLKYAWGQTSDEFQVALQRLKNELLLVAIDFINDNRFATVAPVKIESKADILTTGFTMSIGFDETSLRDAEQIEIPIEIYAKLLPDHQINEPLPALSIIVNVTATLPGGRTRQSVLHFIPEKKATLTVGRIKEIDLYLDDDSVSKHHASLAMNAQGVLRVADIGSTNGTFLNGTRIAYGKAYEIPPGAVVGFGDVTAAFEWKIPKPEPALQTKESEAPAPVERANLQMPVADQSGIKIGVKSAAPKTDEESELATVFSHGEGAESKDGEQPATLDRETINQDEPKTVNNLEINKDKTSDAIADEPKTSSFTERQSSVESLSHQIKSDDFTQSLETNELGENTADNNLQGFDSLIGKSNDISKETNGLDETHLSKKS